MNLSYPQSAPLMDPDDLASIIYSLRSAHAVLERRREHLVPAEVSALTMLDILRRELEAKLAEADTFAHHFGR